jgi:TM2 domain-containing membrane protein YozV
MRLIILIWLCSTLHFAQTALEKTEIDLHSTSNIKIFADHLFCEKDYLRAIQEYQRYLSLDTGNNDTIRFKIGLSLQRIGRLNEAADYFDQETVRSVFFKEAGREYFKSYFLQENYNLFRSNFNDKINSKPAFYSGESKNLYYFSFLFAEEPLPEKSFLLTSVTEDKRGDLDLFYDKKISISYKNPVLAGLLSALIPGAGKIYTHQFGDGITAAIVTGLTAFLAYSNFKAGHKFRGWAFAAASAFFYGGNIYGSAVSAQIYNAQLRFNFDNELKIYIEQNNYFLPEYDFCK